jgi:hypothetical protein
MYRWSPIGLLLFLGLSACSTGAVGGGNAAGSAGAAVSGSGGAAGAGGSTNNGNAGEGGAGDTIGAANDASSGGGTSTVADASGMLDGARADTAATDARSQMGPAEAATSVAYPAVVVGGDVAAGIAHLNDYRATLGETAVTLDPTSSTGCEGHVAYLIAEQGIAGQVLLTHDEPDKNNPSYSVANEQAGLQSDLAYGQDGRTGPQSLARAVDLWVNGLYHRHPLLDPGLVKVGAASSGGYNCLNYQAAGNTVINRLNAPTLWPPNGMTDVPRTFGGNEGPCPTLPANPLAAGTCVASGFIPSATFYNWGTSRSSAITSVASATLTDTTTGAATAIPLLAYYAGGIAGHDPAAGFMVDEIALVPMASLPASRKLQVDIVAVVRGTQTPLSWTFTTGTRTE